MKNTKQFTLRTRFKKEIVCEFVVPECKSNKVIIICGGAPSYPSKEELMFFLVKKGYWVFMPRYRGSWESDGVFLEKSPHIDVLDIIDSLSYGFLDLWNNEKYVIKNPKIYLLGSSFGGPAVLLASVHKLVKKVVALFPVVDWCVDSKVEPFEKFKSFTRRAFGQGYRANEKNFDKLRNGTFYNPIAHTHKMDKNKIYIIHAKDDEVVLPSTSIGFCKKIGCKLTLLKKGGHLSTSNVLKSKFYNKIEKFYNSN